MITTASLAWELADIADNHLCGSSRSRIFVALGAANFLKAIDALLESFIAAQCALPRDVAYRAGQWLNSYEGTAVEARLRRLIDIASTPSPARTQRQEVVETTAQAPVLNARQRPQRPTTPSVKNVVCVGM